MVYKYFPPNLTHITAYLVKVRCSKIITYGNVETY